MDTLTITKDDLLYQIKLACQMPEYVQNAAFRKITLETAKEKNIQAEAEELQNAADQFRTLHQLLDADDTWRWLDSQHLSIEDFEHLIYVSLMADKLAKALFADQVEAYFYEHKTDFIAAALYEIPLKDEDLALELFYTLEEGEASFFELAHQYIQSPDLRRVCGYRGVLRRENMQPEISAKVFASNPPEILKPITTSQGISLVYVEAIIESELTQALSAQIVSTRFRTWIEQQLQAVKVEAAV